MFTWSWVLDVSIYQFSHVALWFIDWSIVFGATFNNISAIAWRPVLVVEEAGVSGENHRPWESNW
jgi:hypothetical protein